MKQVSASAACLLIVVLGGCASFKDIKPPVADIKDEQEQRRKTAVRMFEEKRDYAQLHAALSRWQAGDIKGCREALEKLMIRNPKNHEAQLLLADLMLFEQQPEAAMEQLQQALQDDPSNARAHHTMGLLLESNGQAQEAAECFERAAELEPANELYGLSYRTNQESSAHGGKEPVTNAALAQDEQWADLGASPKAKELLVRAGRALTSGQVGRARTCFLQAAQADPGNRQIPLRAAVFSLRCEHPEIAVDLLNPAVKRFPNSVPLLRALGTAHYRLGEYRPAADVLGRALSLDKSDALAYFLMGCTLKKLGQPEAAQSHFEQARSLNPSFAVSR